MGYFLGGIGALGFWSMMIFLGVLTIDLYMSGKRSFGMGIKFNLSQDKQKQIPEEFKDLAKDFAEKGFITTLSDNLINWARTGSLHWMTLVLLVVLLK